MSNTNKHSIEIPYKKIGDYCLPMLTSPDAEHPIGHWGRMNNIVARAQEIVMTKIIFI